MDNDPKVIMVTYTRLYYGDSEEWANQLLKHIKDCDPNSFHAMRDRSKIGQSIILKDAKILTKEEEDKYFGELTRQSKKFNRRGKGKKPRQET